MAIFLVASDRPAAGKTSIAAGMATALARSGVQAAVCKPLSPAGSADPDTVYFAAGFRGAVGATSGEDDAGLDSAATAVHSLTAGAEPILVEVANPASGSGLTSPLLSGLASRLSARVVAIFGYRSDLSAVSITSDVASLGEILAGVIINQVPRYRTGHAAGMLAETAAAGMPALAQLPEDRAMLSVTMAQLAQQLDGHWELEPSDAETWVDRFLIGGNIMDSGEGYFGRFPHQAVITRAERPDIQMASLMQGTRCLVLTGGGRPTEYIRVEAAKRDVPVLLVDGSTTATADAIGGILGAVVPHNLHKAEVMADLLAEQIDMPTLLG